MDLKNRNILVTGGAVRVGRAITKTLIHSGARVFCHYHTSRQAAEALRSELAQTGGEPELVQGDLREVAEIRRVIDTVVEKGGSIDVLINNAGIFFKTPLGEVTEEQWDNLFTMNLKSPFFCAQYAGELMRKKGSGKIINIGDPSGLNPWPGFIPYGLTKSGIISMTKGLARALAPDVQVNCINPGPVMLPENYSESERSRALGATLLKREGSPGDIAATVRFLLEDSDYITGSIINVDGGRSIA
jgi:NAD(P)-dependent dehydrogenase (short-subunit alcohol dehydrogenase family)